MSFTTPLAYGTVLCQHVLSHVRSVLLPHFPAGDAQANFPPRIICNCIKDLPGYLDGQQNQF